MRKLKILHLLASPVMGGAEKLVLGLGSNIDAEKFDFILGVFVYDGVCKNQLYHEAKRRGLQVEIIRINRHPYSLSQLADISRIIRKYAPDVIHTHGYKTNLLGFVFGKLRNIPIISTCHGWLTSRNWKTAALSRVNLICLRFFNQVIAVSDDIRETISKFGVPRKMVVVLKNMPIICVESKYGGVDRLRDTMKIPEDAKLVGFVGRLEKIKGCDTFIEAAADVVRTVSGCRFIIVGDGSQKEALEKRVKTLGIEKKVHFLGYVEEPGHIFEQLDIYVLPSRNEGLPLTLLEAMYYGVPVIATAVGGIPEVIRNGVSGLLVAPENPMALAAAIVGSIKAYQTAEEMTKEAKRIVDDEFSIKKWVRHIEEIYLRVVESR